MQLKFRMRLWESKEATYVKFVVHAVCAYAYMHVCVHVCMCACVCVCACVRVYICM